MWFFTCNVRSFGQVELWQESVAVTSQTAEWVLTGLIWQICSVYRRVFRLVAWVAFRLSKLADRGILKVAVLHWEVFAMDKRSDKQLSLKQMPATNCKSASREVKLLESLISLLRECHIKKAEVWSSTGHLDSNIGTWSSCQALWFLGLVGFFSILKS